MYNCGMTELKPPQEKVYWRGKRLNRRTVAALKWAEKKADLGKKTLVISQGSYTGGAVAASGSTHNGGGAVDISDSNLTTDERIRVVRALKDAGFAAWFRADVPDLWGSHIHAILKNDPELSSGAKYQVTAFMNGRDGLRGNRADDTYRPDPAVRFSYSQQKPVPE